MKAPAMLEVDWQRRVVDYARLCRWKVWHDNDSRRNAAGLPDLVLVRERVVWAELKAERGRLKDAQRDWINALMTAEAEVYAWRPSDWNAVVEVLR